MDRGKQPRRKLKVKVPVPVAPPPTPPPEPIIDLQLHSTTEWPVLRH